MCCPFCDDTSNHLGINLDSKGLSCWRCPVEGTAIKLIMKLERKSYTDVLPLLKRFASIKTSISRKEQNTALSASENCGNMIDFELDLSYALYSNHKEYLADRGFDPDYLEKKYGLRSAGPVGELANRIIIPYKHYGYTVTLQGMWPSRDGTLPYKSLPDPIDTKRFLYNLDTVSDTALVVEGATDVWNIGDGAVGSSGSKVTKAQLKYLLHLKRVFFLFDADEDAQRRARKSALYLSSQGHPPETHIFTLSEGDPAELSTNDVKSLRKEIFGKIY